MKELVNKIKRNRFTTDELYLINILNDVKYDGGFLKIYDNGREYILFVLNCGNISIHRDNIKNSLSRYRGYEYHAQVEYKNIIKVINNSQFGKFSTSWIY